MSCLESGSFSCRKCYRGSDRGFKYPASLNHSEIEGQFEPCRTDRDALQLFGNHFAVRESILNSRL